jgi:hypothetical protein
VSKGSSYLDQGIGLKSGAVFVLDFSMCIPRSSTLARRILPITVVAVDCLVFNAVAEAAWLVESAIGARE